MPAGAMREIDPDVLARYPKGSYEAVCDVAVPPVAKPVTKPAAAPKTRQKRK
jgi:hypothetical protein